MHRHALILFCLTSGLFAPCGEAGQDVLSEWQTLLDEQIPAAEAERKHQQSLQTLMEQQDADVAASAEHQRVRELGVQATEWVAVLRSQQKQLTSLDLPVADRAETIRLLIPGTPPVFVNDAFSFVAVPESRPARSLLTRIDRLIAERDSLVPAQIRQRFLAEEYKRRQRISESGQVQEAGLQLLKLQRQAVLFDPMRFEEVLLRPVRRLGTTDAESDVFGLLARHWVLDSRRVLLAQAERGQEQQQTAASQVRVSSDPESAANDVEADRLQQVMRSLQREVYLARSAPLNRETEEHSGLHQAEGRLGLLMRVAQERHDLVRQQLEALTEQEQWLQSRVVILSAGEMAANRELPALRGQAPVLAAARNKLESELVFLGTYVRYAMACFRLETGRDTQAVFVQQERSKLFRLAAERQADLQLIDVRAQQLQAAVVNAQRLPAEHGGGQQRVVAVELEVLQTERRRRELDMEIARLCVRMLQLAEADPAIAQHLIEQSFGERQK